MAIVLTQSKTRERWLTIWLPAICATFAGVALELVVRAGLLLPWLARGPGVIPSELMGLTMAAALLVPFSFIHWKWSFRFRYAVLADAVFAFGLAGPASLAMMFEIQPFGLDVTGFVLFVPPLFSLALLASLAVYAVRRLLRGEIIEYDGTLCRQCGYSLIGNVSARCPECGTSFDPSLLVEHGRSGTFLYGNSFQEDRPRAPATNPVRQVSSDGDASGE